MVRMTDTAARISRVPGGVDGARIRDLRVEAGLTAEMLAKKAGCRSRHHICDIERGRRQPGVVLLRRIARALGTTSAHLRQQHEATDAHR